MRHFKNTKGYLLLPFLCVIVVGCKTKQQSASGNDIIAFHSSNDIERTKSVLSTINQPSSVKVLIDGKEYEVSETKMILDTIDMKKYYTKINKDSIPDSRFIIFKSREL